MKSITIGDLLRFAQNIDINTEVHIIATRTGFNPVRGAFVALGGKTVLVLTDHDVNADPNAFAAADVPVKYMGEVE